MELKYHRRRRCQTGLRLPGGGESPAGRASLRGPHTAPRIYTERPPSGVADVVEPRGGLAPHVPVDSTVTQTSVDCGYQLEFDLS